PGFCWRPVAATTSINIDIDGAYNLRLRVFISRNPLQRTQPWPPATGPEEMPATTDVAGGYIFFFAATAWRAATRNHAPLPRRVFDFAKTHSYNPNAQRCWGFVFACHRAVMRRRGCRPLESSSPMRTRRSDHRRHEGGSPGRD